ncbi:MAG TPA: sigma-70 family RNA polymerase sigma factor [Nitrospira sp.]|nr:sigma-70 family RNA polymerase sigma factor [Nitrospira sp.]
MDRDGKSVRFVTLVEPHLADAYALARWLTRNRDDADEVLQEACIRALAAIEQQSGTNVRAWLLAIIRNTAYTWLKAKKRISLIGLDSLSEKDLARVEEGGAQGVPTTDPEAEMIARADAQNLEKHINELPIEFREALVLRDIQGLGYHEIAQVTGVPVGTVMSRLARARRRLISALKETEA